MIIIHFSVRIDTCIGEGMVKGSKQYDSLTSTTSSASILATLTMVMLLVMLLLVMLLSTVSLVSTFLPSTETSCNSFNVLLVAFAILV